MKLQTRTCTGGTAGQAGCPGSTMQSIACTGGNCQPPTRCHLSTNAVGDYTCTQYAAFGYCVSYAVYMQANCAKACCLADPSGGICTGTDLYGAIACQANRHQCSNATVKLLCARTCNPYC
uniref:ShKT domain-containing protein n=1 Tax=Ciona savignyi TaxID=51511 RepID=H2YWA3_CIOSA